MRDVEISKQVLDDNIIVLEILGEVDAYAAKELNSTMVKLLEQGHQRIVLVVSNMIFISSAGVRTILFVHKEAVQLGGEIRVVGPSDQVRRIFEITGLPEVIQITDELQESISYW